MKNRHSRRPLVLVIAGHDPCGGAGIQADIETITSLGANAATIITSLTIQNTQAFRGHLPQGVGNFIEQMQLVMADLHISACKIGAIGHPSLVDAIHDLLTERDLPVVLDPVLQSTTGHAFADKDQAYLLCTRLLPLTTILTPNLDEARQLTNETSPERAAKNLLASGCANVLITGVERSGPEFINHLYTKEGECRSYTWERLSGDYHGSGCTLSSAITTLLARGDDICAAVEKAQQYTWKTLEQGLQLGKGQLHPDRFFWHHPD